MIKKLCLAAGTTGLLFIAACSTTPTTCCTSPDSGSARESHVARYGTNQLHYVTVGKGDHTLVLIHCWAGNSGFWNEQIPALADKARLILIDLPGHGQSDKPHVDYTMDYFAGSVLAVMQAAHVDKATLIGHSMGVPIICRVYVQAPDKVAGLVAVDGTLRRPKMTPDQAEQFQAPFRSPDYRTHVTNFIAAMFPAPGTQAAHDRVLSEILETPQYVMLGAMAGMFNPDQPDWALTKVDVPVIVINASNPMWTDDYKQYVKSVSSRTDYVLIEGTGHWLMLEKPAEFNTALVRMLQEFDLIGK